jgi:transcriptional regulator with XRE-family HTH domain
VSPLVVNLRPFRERAGLSQAELARRARVSQSIISRLEAGQTPAVTLANLDRLAATLGVAPGRLLVRRPARRRRP